MKIHYLARSLPLIFTCMISAHISTQINYDHFLRPISFAECDLADYFYTRLNDKQYARHILPRCFDDVGDFLQYSETLENPRTFATFTFDLFHQRLKGASWVNALALLSFLEEAHPILSRLCRTNNEYLIRDQVKELLYEQLIARYDDFKQDPEQVIVDLSSMINGLYSSEKALEFYEMQNALTRFIEGALDKLIWNPRLQEGVWQSAKHISEKIHQFTLEGIIEEHQAHMLYWSIIYRLCYFLEVAGSNLNLECYEAIRHDIATGTLAMLQPEPEELILSKKEQLLSALLTGEGKARALARNIITDEPPTLRR